MPTATALTKTIPKMRDPSYFGVKPKHKPAKSIPWVDVSDDDSKAKHIGLKRRNSLVNGSSDQSRNGQNAHKNKKRRSSVHQSPSTESRISTNEPGSSQTKRNQGASSGSTPPHTVKTKAIQEQRRQLPIAKGAVYPACFRYRKFI